jgi:hypothetical protein
MWHGFLVFASVVVLIALRLGAVAESSHRQTHDSVPSKEFATLAAVALGPAEPIKESPLNFQHFDPRNFLS